MTENAAFDNFILRRFESARLHTGQKGGLEILLDCPACGAEMRCSLSPSKRYYNCYKCGGGKLIDWLIRVTGLPAGDAYRLLNNKAPESLEDFDSTVKQFLNPEKPQQAPGEGIVQYVQQFLPIGRGNVVADLLTKDYLTARGFSLEYAAQWGLLYADGATKFHDRIVIPVWEDGVLVYFQGRSIIGAEPKYYNPSSKDGCDRNQYVWNLDVARQYSTVFVTEGAFNGMSIGPNVISPFGKEMHDYQLNKIRAKLQPGTHVVFAFDCGAEDKAYKAAEALSGSFRCSILWMPDKRDLNDWFKTTGYAAIEHLLANNLVKPDVALYAAFNEGRVKSRKLA